MNRLSQTLLTTTAISCMAFSALANPITGSVEVELKENSSDKWASTTTLGASMSSEGSAFGGFNIESVDGATFALDEWNLGTTVGEVSVSLGDQGDIWIGAEGEHTIANMAMDESLRITMGTTSVALEFEDYKNDISDIESIALASTVDTGALGITGALDYDLDSENWVIGTRVDMGNYGTALTYSEDTEKLAYEVDGNLSGITIYVNGDEDELARNLGASYLVDVSGLDIEPKLNYDLDAEELTPSIVLTLNF